MIESRLTPYTQIGLGALVCAVGAGTWVAISAHSRLDIWGPAIALGISLLLLGLNFRVLLQREALEWERFRLVAGTALGLYVLRTGLIGYAFLSSGQGSDRNILFVFALGLYAVEVPMIMGLTATRRRSDEPGETLGAPPEDWA